jgi:hypothetical protein
MVVAIALLLPSAGIAAASNGGSGGTAAGPHAFGRVQVGEYGGGPIGWVTFDVHPSTAAHPGFGTFQFDGLKGVTNYPVTTRAVVEYVDFYPEEDCCGFPDVAIIFGTECLYYSSGENYCRDFTAGVYDGGPGTRHDFFRWDVRNAPESLTEYWTGQGSLTVNLGP